MIALAMDAARISLVLAMRDGWEMIAHSRLA